MAGLLDFEDPQQAGLLALAQGLFAAGAPQNRRVGLGEALAGGMGNMQQAQMQAEMLRRKKQEQDMAAQMQQMQYGQMQQKIKEQEAARQQAALMPQIIAKFGNDYQGMVRAGIDPAFVKQLAESQNYGRNEVARVEELSGVGGKKIKQQFDKYGNEVGNALDGYVAPQLVDDGQTQRFVTPQAGLNFKKMISPTEQQANARAWAGLGLQKQGMDQAERHFIANQDLKKKELGYKEEEKTLAKEGQLATFDTMLNSINRLQNHTGLSRSVGLYSKTPTMPGSDSANFQAELETFQSQAFLPMVSQLKGMGALSDAEGKKLTAAVGALDPKMSEQAFKASLKRIQDDMEAARQRMIKGTNLPARKPMSGNSDIEALLGKYGG